MFGTMLLRRLKHTPAAKPAAANGITRLSLIPGDGIGPEIAAAVVRVFEAARVPVQWEHVNVSPVVSSTGRTAIPEAALKTIKELRYGLKGPLATPVGRGHVSLNLTLRKALNLYANVRPCRSIAGYKTLYDNVDTVVIRENTEGEYSGIEHEVVKGVMQSVKLITRGASERIARYGFQYAVDCGRNHGTIVHKAAIM
jgi:isocitrate dehydrogenase (NAD+)